MKITPEIELEVARIDQNIDQTRASMQTTDDTILRLTKLNEGRKQYLKTLGQRRAELMTFELELS